MFPLNRSLFSHTLTPLLAACLCLLGLAACLTPSRGTDTSGAGTTISAVKGIDVSAYDGPSVDFQKAYTNSGVRFAMVRVAYRGYGAAGTLATDKYYQRNLVNSAKAGMKTGAYVFSQAISVKEAEVEAALAVKVLAPYQDLITMPVVMDYEFSGGSSGRLTKAKLSKKAATDNVLAFARKVRAAGYTPMIYGNLNFLVNHLDMARIDAAEIPVWVAQYYKKCEYGGRYEMWQYSSTTTVDGLPPDVDGDWWYTDDLDRFTQAAVLRKANLSVTAPQVGRAAVVTASAQTTPVSYGRMTVSTVTWKKLPASAAKGKTLNMQAVQDLFTPMKAGESFRYDYYYAAVITLQPTGNNTFAPDMAITVNGSTAGLSLVRTAGDPDTAGSEASAGTSAPAQTQGTMGGADTPAAKPATITAARVYKPLTTSLSKSKIKAPGTQTYTGRRRQPAVTVTCGGKTLKKGTDYTLTYYKNTSIGTATVVIRGTGHYTGTRKANFRIVPAGTSLTRASGGVKSVSLRWKTARHIHGYQIRWSTVRSMKSPKSSFIRSSRAASHTVRRLQRGRTYYFQIRPYKIVNGRYYYAKAWSPVRSARVRR